MSACNSLSRRIALATSRFNPFADHWEIDQRGRIRRGNFVQTFSGEWLYTLDPRADEIHFDDVVVGLARECRYGNQSLEFYSVAEHSVIVSLFCEKLARERGWDEYDVLMAAQCGLMHDGPEAFLGDIPRPLKRQRAMRGYVKLEAKWWNAFIERFDLDASNKVMELVHEVDGRLLADEMQVLLVNVEKVREWRPRKIEPLNADIAFLPWEQAAEVFTRRYLELFHCTVDQVDGKHFLRYALAAQDLEAA